MSIIQAVFLAVLQGLTEFLPISSSAHLILVPLLTSWEDQGLAFDIAVHFGTLLAVIWYFRKDLLSLAQDFFHAPLMRSANQAANEGARLAWCLVLATLPIIVAGFLLDEFISKNFRAMWVIGLASIGFGILLWWSYAQKTEKLDWRQITWKVALIIGLMQVLALIPGTSRSGITMTAGLLLGLRVVDAAKFSFLLSIPTLLGAAILMIKKVLVDETVMVEWVPMMIGVGLSALTAYLCIDWFIKFVTRIGMTPFVIYRVLLGLALLALSLWGFA